MNRSIVFVGVAMVTACGSSTPTPTVETNPRYENDYAGARMEAKRRHLPLAVEVWAPW